MPYETVVIIRVLGYDHFGLKQVFTDFAVLSCLPRRAGARQSEQDEFVNGKPRQWWGDGSLGRLLSPVLGWKLR